MSEALETAIRDLLMSSRDTGRVCDNLLKRLRLESTNRKERTYFVNFLLQAGYYREVLELFSVWFNEKRRLPLYAFCFLLHRAGFKPGVEFLRHFFTGLTTQTDGEPFTHFIPWEEYDPRFKNIRDRIYKKLASAAKDLKDKHLTKLEYLRANRMIDEEERFLNQLVEMYPEDETLRHDKLHFRERWARSILAQKSFELFDKEFSAEEPLFGQEELAAARALIGEMRDLASHSPQYAYNFAIGLYWLELYDHAREVLHYAPSNAARDWFYVELLLKSRRYVEALDALMSIENKYAADPETSFGSTYYRALALEGLGQIGTATELLKSIVSIRPSYRSAHSLLLKWGGRI